MSELQEALDAVSSSFIEGNLSKLKTMADDMGKGDMVNHMVMHCLMVGGEEILKEVRLKVSDERYAEVVEEIERIKAENTQ